MRKLRLPLVVFSAAGAVAAPLLFLVREARTQQLYSPEQPIAYSHAVHAGKYKIDCLYCHYAAERGRHAGVPPVKLCLNCHSVVKADSPEVQKLVRAVETGTPIAWNKVHRFPDHTYFDHSRHVAVAGIKCQECHGPVETMERVLPVAQMSMGSCLRCHRETSSNTGGKVAPSTDCSGCHY